MYLLPKPPRRRYRSILAGRLIRLLLASLLLVVAVAVVLLVTGLPGPPPHDRAAAHDSPPASASAAPRPTARASVTPAPSVHFVADPQPVPILVYHHVRPVEGGPRLLAVSTGEFAAQLAYLRRNHFHPVTLQRVFDAWRGRGTLPAHPIVLSFDDGYLDQYRNAARLLRPYRWPAVLNVIVKNIAPHAPFSPAKVRHMIAWGWEVDSHTISHRALTRLSAAAVRRELIGSRRELRRLFHVPVNFFCYPGGDYNARVERAAARAGYLAATGTDYGAALPAERFALPRIYCYWGESLAVFGRRLRQTIAAAGR